MKLISTSEIHLINGTLHTIHILSALDHEHIHIRIHIRWHKLWILYYMLHSRDFEPGYFDFMRLRIFYITLLNPKYIERFDMCVYAFFFFNTIHSYVFTRWSKGVVVMIIMICDALKVVAFYSPKWEEKNWRPNQITYVWESDVNIFEQSTNLNLHVLIAGDMWRNKNYENTGRGIYEKRNEPFSTY